MFDRYWDQVLIYTRVYIRVNEWGPEAARLSCPSRGTSTRPRELKLPLLPMH